MAIRRMGPPPSSTAAKPALKPLHPAPRPETINPRSPNRKVMVGDGPQVRRPDREAQNKATNKLPKRAPAPSKVNQRLPDPIRAEKGLSLVGLMRKQPRYIINSAEVIVIRDYKPKTTRGGMPAVIGATRDMDTKPLRPHKFKVVGLDPNINTITKQKRIKVSCDCEFFTFYCEYALWTWGAANIEYSNGQPAVVRNSGNVPLVCKHLSKILMTIRERGD